MSGTPSESLDEMKTRARLTDCVCRYTWTEEFGGFNVRMWIRDQDDPTCPVHQGERDTRGPESTRWRPTNPAAWVWDADRQTWCPGEVHRWTWYEGRLWAMAYWTPPAGDGVATGRHYMAVPRGWLREREAASLEGAPEEPPADPRPEAAHWVPSQRGE